MEAGPSQRPLQQNGQPSLEQQRSPPTSNTSVDSPRLPQQPAEDAPMARAGNPPAGATAPKIAPQNGQQPQQQPEQRQPSLKIRIHGLERRGKDLCVRLDAFTNLPAFRLSHYQPFSRSYRELTFFALSLSIHVPSHILSALPLPPPFFDSTPSETRLLCFNLSRWFARLAAEPAHRDHPETRNFIETEYSYHPLPPNPDYAAPLVQKRWKTAMDNAAQIEKGISIDLGAGLGLPSGVLSTSASPSKGGGGWFGGSSSKASTLPGGKGMSLSRNVHDEDEDLVAARMEVTRLELQFSDALLKGQGVIEARSKVSQELNALSNRLHTLAGVEDTRQLSSELGLPNDLRALADGLPAVDLTQSAMSHTDAMTLAYQLSYQSSNARSAKECLLARNALVEEHHDASKRAILKKREVETLKSRMGSGGINRDRIELAIEEFGEATRYANALRYTLAGLSKTMHDSLKGHSKNAHADLQGALMEHAKGSVYHLQRNLMALKGLRADLRGQKRPEQPNPIQPEVPSLPEELAPRSSTSTEATAVDPMRASVESSNDLPASTSSVDILSPPLQSDRTDGFPQPTLASRDSWSGGLQSNESIRPPSLARQDSVDSSTSARPSLQQPEYQQSTPVMPAFARGLSNDSTTMSSADWSSQRPAQQEEQERINATQSMFLPPPSMERNPSYQQDGFASSTQQQNTSGFPSSGSFGGGSGFLPRNDAGFGSARGGGGFGSAARGGRGGGRISAAEAARSLAGRF